MSQSIKQMDLDAYKQYIYIGQSVQSLCLAFGKQIYFSNSILAIMSVGLSVWMCGYKSVDCLVIRWPIAYTSCPYCVGHVY